MPSFEYAIVFIYRDGFNSRVRTAYTEDGANDAYAAAVAAAHEDIVCVDLRRRAMADFETVRSTAVNQLKEKS